MPNFSKMLRLLMQSPTLPLLTRASKGHEILQSIRNEVLDLVKGAERILSPAFLSRELTENECTLIALCMKRLGGGSASVEHIYSFQDESRPSVSVQASAGELNRAVECQFTCDFLPSGE